MTTVERHPVDTAFAEKVAPQLGASFERNTPDVADDASGLTTLLDTALLRLGNQCVIDPSAAKLDTWVSFTHATQAATAIFAAATGTANHVECMIDQKYFAIPTTGPTYYSDPVRWQTALWLSVISRDHDRIRALSAVDEPTLRTESDEFDEYVYAWIAALQAYFGHASADVPDNLQEATRLLSPSTATKSHPDQLNLIVRPQLLLFLELASQNEAGFNDLLRECLEAHREFWTADRKASSNPLGYVALAPLALTCVARDVGFSVDIESDYMPVHLIKGSWIREFRF